MRRLVLPAFAVCAALSGADNSWAQDRSAVATELLGRDQSATPRPDAKGSRQLPATIHKDVRLGTIPTVKLKPRPPLTKEKQEQINKDIHLFRELEGLNFGFTKDDGVVIRRKWATRAQVSAFLLAYQGHKSFNAMRDLLLIGPEALPSLLAALDDPTHTRLKIDKNDAGYKWWGNEVQVNPVNKFESAFASKFRSSIEESAFSRTGSYIEQGEYTVKVGDAAFVVIGRIVGRSYSAVRSQPTMNIIINSPTNDPKLRAKVRTIWSSQEPVQRLFDSLLMDFATEGVYDDAPLNGWHDGSDFQIEAALRLLYYFPDESIPLFVKRLNNLDVQKTNDFIKRNVKNGVVAVDLIEAVSWCKDARVGAALASIRKRTNDTEIIKALDKAKD
jgi:hypothetical protein